MKEPRDVIYNPPPEDFTGVVKTVSLVLNLGVAKVTKDAKTQVPTEYNFYTRSVGAGVTCADTVTLLGLVGSLIEELLDAEVFEEEPITDWVYASPEAILEATKDE